MRLSATSGVWSGVHQKVVMGPTLYAESKKTGVMFRTAELDRADDITFRSLEAAANVEKIQHFYCKDVLYILLMILAFQI
jgi:hypothetical protein